MGPEGGCVRAVTWAGHLGGELTVRFTPIDVEMCAHTEPCTRTCARLLPHNIPNPARPASSAGMVARGPSSEV